MFCYKCGQQLPDNSKFCSNCGTALIQQPQTTYQPQMYGQQTQVQSFIKVNLKGKSIALLTLMIINALVMFFVPILAGSNSSNNIYFIGEKNWPSKIDNLEGTEIIFFIAMLTAIIIMVYTFLIDKKKPFMTASIVNFASNALYCIILFTTIMDAYETGNNPVPVNTLLNVYITGALMIMAIVAYNKSKRQNL